MKSSFIAGFLSLLALPCFANDWSLGGVTDGMAEIIDHDTVRNYQGFKEAVILQVVDYPEITAVLAKELFDCKTRRFIEGDRYILFKNGNQKHVPGEAKWISIIRGSTKDGTLSEVCHRTMASSFPSDASIASIIVSVKEAMKKQYR